MAGCFLAITVLAYSIAAEPVDRDLNDRKIVYPEKFGNHTLGSCSGAPGCGTAMAEYGGIYAYSNGADQCTGYSCGGYVATGYQYQCVEYAQRFFNAKHGTAANWYANAIDMCSHKPAGVSATNNPQPGKFMLIIVINGSTYFLLLGDLVVFNWAPYGHVAVISAWHGSSFDVVEQNSSPNGRNTYSTLSGVSCYLTAGGGGGGCPNGGYYCGNNGISGDVNTKYHCSGAGAAPSAVGCGFTCAAYPEGYDDVCVAGSCSGLVGGYYCGNDKIGGDANTLYKCYNGAPAGAKHCSNGCSVQPAGTDDRCNYGTVICSDYMSF